MTGIDHQLKMHSRFLLYCLCCLMLLVQVSWGQVKTTKVNKSGLSASEIALASQISERISTTEWLGALAPVALSPFFGIACLSGLALFGGDWIPGGNALLENSVVNNPAIFWTFLVLSIITSLPRLSKLSKPFAQAIDQVEAYAGIITLLVIRFWAVGTIDEPAMDAVVMQAGLFSITMDGLLAIAAMGNILVVNSVKFFFEFMIWITPIPFLDACFELANKSMCAALMGIYAYSPTVATAINIALFVISLFILRWTHRRVIFYRTMCLDPILARCFKGYGSPHQRTLVVFPHQNFGDFPEKSRLLFQKQTDGTWTLSMPRMFRAPQAVSYDSEEIQPYLKRGWLTNSLLLNLKSATEDEAKVHLVFSHRYFDSWAELCECLGAISTDESLENRTDRKVEFA